MHRMLIFMECVNAVDKMALYVTKRSPVGFEIYQKAVITVEVPHDSCQKITVTQTVEEIDEAPLITNDIQFMEYLSTRDTEPTPDLELNAQFDIDDEKMLSYLQKADELPNINVEEFFENLSDNELFPETSEEFIEQLEQNFPPAEVQ